MRVAFADARVIAEWHNIWEDDRAAAFVRGVASGNETVPTVVIDGQVHVAPSPRRALAEIVGPAPQLVFHSRQWTPLRVAQWGAIAAVLVISELAAVAGQLALSWALDAAAIVTYAGMRRLRARSPRRSERQAEVTGFQ